MRSVDDTHDDEDQAEKGSLLASVSAEMVRLYKEQFGRGPTKVRTRWAGRDTLVVLLEDTLTPAERQLVALREYGRLRETRMVFQYSWVTQFCEPVERLTGRKVKAFLSGIDPEADGMALETFVLHPEGYDGPGRASQPSTA